MRHRFGGLELLQGSGAGVLQRGVPGRAEGREGWRRMPLQRMDSEDLSAAGLVGIHSQWVNMYGDASDFLFQYYTIQLKASVFSFTLSNWWSLDDSSSYPLAP